MKNKKFRIMKLLFRTCFLYSGVAILYSGFVLSRGHDLFWLPICALPAAAVSINIFPGTPGDSILNRLEPLAERSNPAVLYLIATFFFTVASLVTMINLGSMLMIYALLRFEPDAGSTLIGLSMDMLFALISSGTMVWYLLLLLRKRTTPTRALT